MTTKAWSFALVTAGLLLASGVASAHISSTAQLCGGEKGKDQTPTVTVPLCGGDKDKKAPDSSVSELCGGDKDKKAPDGA